MTNRIRILCGELWGTESLVELEVLEPFYYLEFFDRWQGWFLWLQRQYHQMREILLSSSPIATKPGTADFHAASSLAYMQQQHASLAMHMNMKNWKIFLLLLLLPPPLSSPSLQAPTFNLPLGTAPFFWDWGNKQPPVSGALETLTLRYNWPAYNFWEPSWEHAWR